MRKSEADAIVAKAKQQAPKLKANARSMKPSDYDAFVDKTVKAMSSLAYSMVDPITPPPPPPPPSKSPAERLRVRSDGRLTWDGQQIYLAGGNAHSIAFHDWGANGERDYIPSRASAESALQAIKKFGGRLVRSHTLGITTGSANAARPNPNQVNEAAMDNICWIVARCLDLGLIPMVPFSDEHEYWHGGYKDIERWALGSNFYRGAEARKLFKELVQTHLTWKNPYTGRTLGEDVPIWETMNEGYSATEEWTADITAWTKRFTPGLVADGNTLPPFVGKERRNVPLVDGVDIVGMHFYPEYENDDSVLEAQCELAHSRGKAFLVGEWPVYRSNRLDWLRRMRRVADGHALWTVMGDGMNYYGGQTRAYYDPARTAEQAAQKVDLAQTL